MPRKIISIALALAAGLVAAPSAAGPLDPLEPIVEALVTDVDDATCPVTGVPLMTTCPAWKSARGAPGTNEEGSGLVLDEKRGRLYVIGFAPAANGQPDYLTVAYDAATGAAVWEARYDGPSSREDFPMAIALDEDAGRVYVTGSSRGLGGREAATVAYDADTGDLLWARRYAGPVSNGWYHGTRIALSEARDGLYVSGWGPNVSTGDDFFLLALDPVTGSPRWTGTYDDTGTARTQIATAVGVAGGDAVVVQAGWSIGPGGATDRTIVVLGHDAVTGARQWELRYDGPLANGWDESGGLVVSPSGDRVYVTGTSANADGDGDLVVLAIDIGEAAEAWVVRYDGVGGHDGGTALATSPDGEQVLVTGLSTGLGTNLDIVTLALDVSTGATRWVQRLDGRSRHEDRGHAVALNADGSVVFVTGETRSSRGTAVTTVAYRAADAKRLWIEYDDDGYWGIGRGIRVARSGAVYVAGRHMNPDDFSYDMLTIAYAPPLTNRLDDSG